MSQIPLVFIIAGEASGDQLGGDLMASLKAIGEVKFAGIGGSAMAKEGLNSLFPMEDLSIMGILGILRDLPRLWRRLNDTIKTIHYLKPDAVITIDAPEFNFRILKRLHKYPARPRLIHYVAPTVWAWRPGRARKISHFVDRLFCLYSFELPYFTKHGLKSIFVGHPVIKQTVEQEERDSDLICVLPGSRRSEIQALLPIFKETIKLIHQEIPSLKVIIPTLPSMQDFIEQGTNKWPVNVQIVIGDHNRRNAFQRASVALAASGTVALQMAAAGLPFIIAYKVEKLNEWIGKIFLKTPWACMVNILLAFKTLGAGFILTPKAKEKITEPWIPEFLQNDCNPENLKKALLKLLRDSKAREHQLKGMKEAIDLLKAPSHLAAKNVWEEIKNFNNLKE